MVELPRRLPRTPEEKQLTVERRSIRGTLGGNYRGIAPVRDRQSPPSRPPSGGAPPIQFIQDGPAIPDGFTARYLWFDTADVYTLGGGAASAVRNEAIIDWNGSVALTSGVARSVLADPTTADVTLYGSTDMAQFVEADEEFYVKEAGLYAAELEVQFTSSSLAAGDEVELTLFSDLSPSQWRFHEIVSGNLGSSHHFRAEKPIVGSVPQWFDFATPYQYGFEGQVVGNFAGAVNLTRVWFRIVKFG